MYAEEFPFEENSLDVLLKFPSETENEPAREDLFLPLPFQENPHFSLNFPFDDDLPMLDSYSESPD